MSNNLKCNVCGSDATHSFVGAKDGVEYTFSGCKEHFLGLISDKVNNEHYEFRATTTVSDLMQVAVAAPTAPVAAPVSVVTPTVMVSSAPDGSDNDDIVGTDDASGRPISGSGKLRALFDAAQAEAAGFVLQRPLYSVGTKVIDVGVQNFRRSREQFEAKPKVGLACNEFISSIAAEERRDSVVTVNEVGMLPDGRLTRVSDGVLGKSSIVLASPKTLGQLMVRSGLNNTGTGYLEACPTILRAHNVNHWLSSTDAGRKVKFRMRNVLVENKKDHEVYAVVGPNYSAFDADKIAAIVRDVCPPEARAEIVYDGFRTRISVTFHSDIKPEQCVVGEIFKAGIIVKTSDSGDGSIRVSAFVERNLCLNLIIIDNSVQTIVKRRHTGDQNEIANIVRAGIDSANEKVNVFAENWGFANKDDLKKNTIDLERKDDKLSPRFSLSNELFMAGLFNGMIERELVTVKGKREEAINNMVTSWSKEPAVTRAGAINAITRYAHEFEQNSPWDEDVLQEQAGELLYSKRPLPWMQVTVG